MSLLVRSARMKPELLEELQLTKESEAKQLHWGAGPSLRDKQRLLLKLQELKESHSIPVGWRDKLPAPSPAGQTRDTTLDKSAQGSGEKPQLCRSPSKSENFSLPTHIAKVESA